MLRRIRRQGRSGGFTGVKFAVRLAIVCLLCLTIRSMSDMLESAEGFALPDRLSSFLLQSELPHSEKRKPGSGSAVLSDLPSFQSSDSQSDSSASADTSPLAANAQKPSYSYDESPDGSSPNESSDDSAENESSQPGGAISTTITGESGGYHKGAEGIYLKNNTEYDIDVEELLNKPLGFSAQDGAKVLIIHTHGSEAYMPDGDDIYEPSDPSRTEDKNYNVVRVGDELARVLEDRGIDVIHDRELYDYPSYNGSYDRSWEAMQSYLQQYPDIAVIIDLHRDALEGTDGTIYKTVADIGDTPCAQVMLISGTNFSGLTHDNWQENMSFALKLQSAMVEQYPTLARPLNVSQYRYNQNATTGSLIAEIGCNGNTLQEAITAATYFGDCLADVLLGV